MVSNRYIQSSVSYADANHVFWIQAQHTANIEKPKPTNAVLQWPSVTKCAASSPATPKATTNVRS